MKYLILFTLFFLATACGHQLTPNQHVQSVLPIGCAINEASDLICARSVLMVGSEGYKCLSLNCGDQRSKSLLLSECVQQGYADVCLK